MGMPGDEEQAKEKLTLSYLHGVAYSYCRRRDGAWVAGGSNAMQSPLSQTFQGLHCVTTTIES